jgi:anti-anti-sigma factor
VVSLEFNARWTVAKVNIRADDTPQGTVVKIAGEIDVSEVDELERQLQALSSPAAPTAFVVDLSGLTFAASLAIGCLLRFRNQVIAAGGRVALANVPPIINDTFRRAQLHRVFMIFPTVEAAFEHTAVS